MSQQYSSPEQQQYATAIQAMDRMLASFQINMSYFNQVFTTELKEMEESELKMRLWTIYEAFTRSLESSAGNMLQVIKEHIPSNERG